MDVKRKVKTFSTLVALLIGIVSPVQAQRGRGEPGDRFRWENQAPWGVAHGAAIAEAVKLMATDPTDPSLRVGPFKIFDNVYYIGMKNVSAFLVTTTDGLVLRDATFPTSAELTLDNVRKLVK